MSWQLGAFAILAVGLAAGFAWYERSRPDARTLALVATMAALAALGRIAFAALPNVKPSTDIVLITGYALGPAPGFVVGAVTGLVSNFFFGQGPWTAWQMTGWALTGLIGAGLATVTRGRIRRWPLALTCMVVGYAFTALQDVGDWVTYSDHNLGALGLYVGRGTGFDAVHAGGCLVFALAFGPALVRSLRRVRNRLEIRWLPAESPALLPGLLLAAALTAAALAGASAPAVRAAGSPVGYLESAQNADGGFGPGPGSPSAQLYAGWAALGLASAGVNPAAISHGGPSLLAYVEAGAGSSDPGSLERTILVARAAGADPRAFGGQDLVRTLQARIGARGAVSGQVNLTAFAVLALRAAGAPAGPSTLAWLRAQQNSDGGFSYGTAGTASDVDDTGAALEALAGDGADSGAISRAEAFLRQAQNRDGGLPSEPGQPSDAQSTAWAVQGLIAAGADPARLRQAGRSPLDYLRSLLAGDGHIDYAAGNAQTPVWVTAEALMALEGKPLPLAPLPAPASRSAGPSSAHGQSVHPVAPVHHHLAPRDRHRRPPARRPRTSPAELSLAALTAGDEQAILGVLDRLARVVGS